MTDATRTPATICWHCDRMLDAANELGGHAEPHPGAVSICLYCGAIGFFGPDLVLRRATSEELNELEEDREFMQKYMAFSWARQRLMLDVSLLLDRDDPDR